MDRTVKVLSLYPVLGDGFEATQKGKWPKVEGAAFQKD